MSDDFQIDWDSPAPRPPRKAKPRPAQPARPFDFQRLIIWLLILGAAGFIGWNAYQKYLPSTSSGADSAARLAIENYRQGLSQIYKTTSAKARSGEFKSLGDARDYIKSKKDELHKDAFGPAAEYLETINGSDWDNNRAADLFQQFARGFQ